MSTAKKEATKVAKAGQAIADAVDRYAEVKALVATLKEEEEALKALILEAFGDAEVLTHYGVEVARISHRNRKSNDAKMLEKLFPEAYSATLRVTPYSVITNIPR